MFMYNSICICFICNSIHNTVLINMIFEKNLQLFRLNLFKQFIA